MLNAQLDECLNDDDDYDDGLQRPKRTLSSDGLLLMVMCVYVNGIDLLGTIQTLQYSLYHLLLLMMFDWVDSTIGLHSYTNAYKQ